MRKLYLVGACLSLLAGGCGKEQSAPAPAAPAAVKIEQLEPSSTAEGEPFHARPDGQSVLVVFGTDIPAGATVLWNDQPVMSSGGGKSVTGAIPPNLYQNAGTARVAVRSGDTLSNALEFTIYGKTGPAPQVTAVAPTGAVAGKGFNVQPNGDSALGVAGTGFLPGVSVVLDGKKLATVFNRDTLVSAVVPVTDTARAGSHEIWVANRDGKTSNKVEFKVTSQ